MTMRGKTKDRLQSTIEEVDRQFFDAMRRPPTDGDRSLYWSYCYSDNEFKRIMLRSLILANIPKHLIYIYDRTGLMVDQRSYKRLPPEDKLQLEAVKSEFDTLSESKKKNLYQLAQYDDSSFAEDTPLTQALYVLGNFIERNYNAGTRVIDYQAIVVGHLIVRAFRIIRSISRSQSYSTAEEDLLLIRSLYEIYCKLCFALRGKQSAKYLFDSDFGLAVGNFEPLIKDGRVRRHTLVNKKTGKEIPRTRSFYEYISSSPFPEDIELFEALYEYLSSFVHSGSRHIIRTWVAGRGFSLINEGDDNFKAFGLMLTSFVSSMIMQIALRNGNVSKVSKWDISLFCLATRQILIHDTSMPSGSEIANLLLKMKERAKRFPKRVPKLNIETNHDTP